MFTINLKNDTRFICASEDTILIGAQKENLTLDYSCKTGRCQSCKAKVVKGTSLAIVEETGLSEQDKTEGYILTCVRTPTSDLTLHIEDLSSYSLEKVKTIPSKIDFISKISSNVIELHLRIPPNASFNYLSGQYINIIKGDYKRSYSIANTSSASNLVFFIKNYGGGRFSNYLFNEAKINDLLRIEGPIGTFFYRKTPKTNIVFFATGTGIAPVKAILEQMNESHSDLIDKNIYLFFGGRNEEDLFWKPDFKNIKVNFIPVLSRGNADWNGEKGYVQDIVLAKKIDLSDTVLYACGSENMIKDSRVLTIENGLSEDAFYSDAFISS
ncbi:CDP-4-dehydro-6-deoxyglucose reductase [Flavobacterium fluvii]|uniref:CDP-4-dehydro-6-deoxyglucose reductase n=1 Tax=Flavobacterium fluvii TaxID=468056 RepID=A0A1M5IJX5_9FLAO|nr:FAD-binding oxidoreductase [Flavobacterium fluvii]SHG28561.1 CDP-4-dehydro-6-deoxyglucose reductase [Flavobacterium fluvii]